MTHARVDAHAIDGTLLARVTDVESVSFSRRLHEVGVFEVTVPALAMYSDQLVNSYEIRIYEENDGLVFRGLTGVANYELAASGLMIYITGDELSRELVHANTHLGMTFDAANIDTLLTRLLDGTGWTYNVTGETDDLLTARFEGLSVWEALSKAGTMLHMSLRGNLDRTIDFAPFGNEEPIIIQNARTGGIRHHDRPGYTIEEVKLEEEGSDIWNRVIPLGAGEGENTVDMKFADRDDPYPIKSGQNNGTSYYYIEDEASIAKYGLRTKVLSFKDVAPLSNSDGAYRAAGNVLYEHSVHWLEQHSERLEYYDVSVPGFPKGAVPLGEKIRLVYRGIVEAEERRIFKNIDAYMYLMGFDRFIDRQSDRTTLHVANMPRHKHDVGRDLADLFSDMHAVKVGLRPFTYREMHGPQRQSVNAGNPIEFLLDLDDNVSLLHSSKMRVSVRRVRANATGVSSGGQTSNTTSDSGGQFTTTQGASSIAQAGGGSFVSTSQDNTSSGGHTHAVWGTTLHGGGAGGSHQHGMLFPTSLEGAHAHTHSHGFQLPSHSHTVSSHSHGFNLPSHGHSFTVQSHTHTLQYGIFTGPFVDTPQVTININGVNVTAALGGPWNNDFEVDITQYLSDINLQPLRQQNIIQVGSQQLADITVQSKSLVTAYSAIPVA